MWKGGKGIMGKDTVRDWKLERYLLGELPAEEIEGIRTIESARGDIWERAEALRADNAVILERYPPEAMGRKIEKASAVDGDGVPKWRKAVQRYQPPKQSVWTGIPRWVIPATVCAVALLVVPLRLILPDAQVNAGAAQYQGGVAEDRPKGTTPGIEVWRQNGAAAERLPPNAVAHNGDVVQLRYTVPESCYGTLISVDGRGVLTVHLSGEPGKAARLTPGRPIALGNSYQLDDAPLFETFYLVTAKDDFDIEGVAKSLKAAKHPLDNTEKQALPKNQFITAFTLRK
jgi:hypothetical protein